jgi:hypothetical protein
MFPKMLCASYLMVRVGRVVLVKIILLMKIHFGKDNPLDNASKVQF